MFVLFAFLVSLGVVFADPPARLNVLLIQFDDFRPEIAALSGRKGIPTPNLDNLVHTGLSFTRAYVQQAVCSPSRNSFPIGRRPKNSKIWNFQKSFRDTNRHWLTIPQWFKQQGYLTGGSGKFFHPGHPPNNDEPYSWTPPSEGGWDYFDPDAQITYCDNSTHKPIGCYLDEEVAVDWQLANFTVGKLQYVAEKNQSFFLSVGFHRPHPQWALPESAYAALPSEKVPMPKTNMTFTANLMDNVEPPYYSCSFINERTNLTSVGVKVFPYDPLPTEITRDIRRGYFAGTMFLDRMVGMVLDELDSLGLASSTIVVATSDHGWELQERGGYCKQSTSELRTRIPFIIRDPSRPLSHGKRVSFVTEYVNLFATLAELATNTTMTYETDGVSLAPVFSNPSITIPPKSFNETLAFSVFPRCLGKQGSWFPDPSGRMISDNPCTQVPDSEFTHMGYTVRSPDYRYTEWRHWDGRKLQARWDLPPVEVELYNHIGDDGDFDGLFEFWNYANDSSYAPIRAHHAQLVQQMWNSK